MSGAVMAASPRGGAARAGGRQARARAGYRRQGWAVLTSARTITPSEDPGVLTVTGETSPTLRWPTGSSAGR